MGAHGRPSENSRYSQRARRDEPHFIWVIVPFLVGWVISVVLVPYGPFVWWINYLVIGALWGFTKPIRTIVRSATICRTLHFRDPSFTWQVCAWGAYYRLRHGW